MKNRNRLISYTVLLLALLLAHACTKTEYLPVEVGEALPYTDTSYVALEEALAGSTYTQFYQAWQRSALREELLSEDNSTLTYTFLVLDNEALDNAGWDAQRISAASAEELDDLLGPYVLGSNITRERLGQKPSAVIVQSYGAVPDIYFTSEPYGYGHANGIRINDLYFRKAVLRLDDAGNLAVNGRSIGIADAISTDRGTLWPIGDTLAFNLKSAWDVLKEDGRFELYTGITEWADSVYNARFYSLNGYLPREIRTGNAIWPWVDHYYHVTPRQQGMVIYTGTDGLSYVDQLNTWFVPTDEAFQKAGFSTLQELIDFNIQRGEPTPVAVAALTNGTFYYYGANVAHYNAAFTGLEGHFATDSILDYHGLWGMRHADFFYWHTRGTSLFFSNDLTDVLNQQLLLGTVAYRHQVNGVWRYTSISHYSPLVALSETEISAPGHTANSIHISQPDIYTLNGVIHVVDDLFQLNNN